jgi:hypothetical protein
MPKSLFCASFVSACIRALKREESCVLAKESESGSRNCLLARLRSISGIVAARAWASWRCVSASVVPAWPIGMATNSTFRHTSLSALTRGMYLVVFS